MSTPTPNDRPNQKLTAGRDATQVGGDYRQTTTFNFVFLIIGVLALGGLAWGLYLIGSNPGSVTGNPTQVQPSPVAEETPE